MPKALSSVYAGIKMLKEQGVLDSEEVVRLEKAYKRLKKAIQQKDRRRIFKEVTLISEIFVRISSK